MEPGPRVFWVWCARSGSVSYRTRYMAPSASPLQELLGTWRWPAPSSTPYPHLPTTRGRGCAVVGCCPGSPIFLAISLSNLIFDDLAGGALAVQLEPLFSASGLTTIEIVNCIPSTLTNQSQLASATLFKLVLPDALAFLRFFYSGHRFRSARLDSATRSCSLACSLACQQSPRALAPSPSSPLRPTMQR